MTVASLQKKEREKTRQIIGDIFSLFAMWSRRIFSLAKLVWFLADKKLDFF